MQCEVWSVECEDFASSLAEKKPLVEGRTRSGQVFLRTIGHLFLGNFHRRLARVYVTVDWKLRILLWHCIIQWTGSSGSSSGTV